MANFSTAFGVCIMLGESDQLKTLYNLMKKLQKGEYTTNIDNFDILSCSEDNVEGYIRSVIDSDKQSSYIRKLKIDDLLERVLSSNKSVLVSNFWGFGKWSYDVNIQHLLDWLKEYASESELSLINTLDGVELTFIYIDEEQGNGHLAFERYTIKYELEDGVVLQKDVEKTIDRYEYNAENLMKLDIFDECYDLTKDTVSNLLLNATDEELEYLGLTGLVTEYTIKNVELIDLIDKSNGEILFYVTDIEEYLDIDTLRERLKVLKENEYQ